MFLVWGVICSQDKMENVSFRAIWYQQQQRQRQQPAAAAAAGQQQQAKGLSGTWVQIHFIYLNIYIYIFIYIWVFLFMGDARNNLWRDFINYFRASPIVRNTQICVSSVLGVLQCGFQSLGLLEQHWVQHTWAAQAWGQQQQASSSRPAAAAAPRSSIWFVFWNIGLRGTSPQPRIYSICFVFWNLGCWRTSPQQRIKDYLLFGWFFDTLVFDKHHCNEEFHFFFYVSGLGRYLQPRQNGKCQFRLFGISRSGSSGSGSSSSSRSRSRPAAAGQQQQASSSSSKQQQQQASSSSSKQHQVLLFGCFLKPWFLTNITATKN